MPRRPNLFIVGAPKCGTTSLYEYLRGHPDVFMSVVKEPGFFGGHASGATTDLNRYLSYFAGARDEKIVGEASVGYIYTADAPARIREFAPDALIIAMFRNPVDMLFSLHAQRLLEGREDVEDFATALSLEDARRRGERLPPGVAPEGAMYRDRVEFARHLRRWLAEFGTERVHVVIFEDLANDPRATFRQVLDFLGVDAGYAPATFEVHNPASRSRSALLMRLRKSRPAQWLAWRLMPAMIGDTRARQLVSWFHHSRLNRRSASRQRVPPVVRQQLETELLPEVEQLSELLDRDLRGLWFGRAAEIDRGASSPGPT